MPSGCKRTKGQEHAYKAWPRSRPCRVLCGCIHPSANCWSERLYKLPRAQDVTKHLHPLLPGRSTE
eukprot:642071-Amphidinium_carterae.1